MTQEKEIDVTRLYTAEALEKIKEEQLGACGVCVCMRPDIKVFRNQDNSDQVKCRCRKRNSAGYVVPRKGLGTPDACPTLILDRQKRAEVCAKKPDDAQRLFYSALVRRQRGTSI